MNTRLYLLLASFFGALSVVLGAFGAHGLKGKLSPELLTSFDTGVKYQFYHSIAIILVCVLYRQYKLKALQRSALFFAIGIILFSTSIYLLSTRSLWLTSESLQWLWPITPIGGLFFVTGWVNMFLAFLKAK